MAESAYRPGTCLFDEVSLFLEEEQAIINEQRSNGGAAAMFRDATSTQVFQGMSDTTVFGAELTGQGTFLTIVFSFAYQIPVWNRQCHVCSGSQAQSQAVLTGLVVVEAAVSVGRFGQRANLDFTDRLATFMEV